jgi:hypothetical protein
VLTVLVLLGTLGLLVVVLGLVFGELLDGAVEGLLPGDVAPGLTTALAAALSAFGFGAALALRGSSLPTSAALGLGAVGAVAVGVAAFLLSRAVIGREVAAPSGDALYGVFGALVTPVPKDGYGEVSVVVHGTRRKLSARAEQPLPAGASVYVLEVLSETSVLVAPADPLSLL